MKFMWGFFFNKISLKHIAKAIFHRKKHKLHLSRLFCCNHTCYCVNVASVTPASRYITSASRFLLRYQSRSSMYIRGLIPRNSAKLARQFRLGAMVWSVISTLSYLRYCLFVFLGITHTYTNVPLLHRLSAANNHNIYTP